jgi:pyruvate dehydrogenase E1 component alpha subunit
VTVDGNDVVAVWQAANAAIRRAREGLGPTLLECATYRLRGHVEYEVTFLSKTYREKDEVEARHKDDPILRFRDRLLSAGTADGAALDAVEADVEREVADAVAFAAEAPWPDPATATDYMCA